MLRRVGLQRMAFSAGGGSAIRMEKRPPSTPAPLPEPEEPAGVYLPWTARPWPVTHSVHHAQWKFLDTVFSHLSTVTPAELSERAREQGARDVLRDLEEPVMGLLRQQARTARQLRRQAKATPNAEQRREREDEGESMKTSAPLTPISTAAASRSDHSGGGDVPTSCATEAESQSSIATERTTEISTVEPCAVAEASTTTAASSSSSSSKRKRSKKSKARKQSVDVIHYL